LDQLGIGSGSQEHRTPVLPRLPVQRHGSTPDSSVRAAGCEEGVQGVGGGLLQRPDNSLEGCRIRMITAVRRYLNFPSMAHVDFYAGGVPKYRAELLKFAAWVAKHGEPAWFDRPESR
jgi:hypothetical protein